MAGKRQTALMSREDLEARMPVRRGEFIVYWNRMYNLTKHYERQRKWYRRAGRWLRGEGRRPPPQEPADA